MFAFTELSKFESEKIAFKILKPWWDVITDYLVMFLMMVPILVGGMEITSGVFACVAAVECPLSKNGTLLPGINHRNACSVFSSSKMITDGSTTAVITVLKDQLQYASYVNSECSKSAMHWFVSYFSLLLFFQVLILFILDNFWLKFPTTASNIEHFSALVVECYNSPGTNFCLSRTLWNLPDRNQTTQEVNGSRRRSEQNSNEDVRLLDENQFDSKYFRSAASSDNLADVDVDVTSAIAVKSLYEKVKRFKDCIKSSHMIWKLYFAQAGLQTLLTLVFLLVDALNMKHLQGTMKCNVHEQIPVEHDYFICSHNLTPVFEIALSVFLLLLTSSFFFFTFILIWTYRKVYHKRIYDFVEELKPWINTESQTSDFTTAEADMGFLLHLLHAYNRLYVVRFAIYMSEASEKKVRAFILDSEWPVTKLENHSEHNGSKLSLSRLNGIPRALFDLVRLITLELTQCGPLQDDDFKNLEELTDLRNLSLVNCGLTKIPENVLKMTWIELLVLKNNSIKSIQEGISNLKYLTYLDLTHNELKDIAESFQNFDNLFTVKLSNNPDLELSAIKNVLACKSLHVLEIFPLTVAQENDLSDEERNKLRKVSILYTSSLKRSPVFSYTPEGAPHINVNDLEALYQMSMTPKGIAVIINIYHFQENVYADRLGSNIDVSRLNNLLEQIGFKTVIYSNCTAAEVKQVLKKHAEDKTYECCGSILVAIMTHGSEHGLIFADDKVVSVNELVSIVVPHYPKKPKLFFIQSCRGKRIVRDRACHPIDDIDLAGLITADGRIGLQRKNSKKEQNDAAIGFIEPPFPQEADVLLSFSTLPGFVSFRSTKCGSWYIAALIEIFSNYAWKEDILSLLTMVNYRVASTLSTSGWRQIPAPQSTLTKKLYLLPGYPAQEKSRAECSTVKEHRKTTYT